MVKDNEMVEVELGTEGEVLPPKNDMIALIDADTVLFAASVVSEYFEELLPRDMYTDEEWAIVISDPGYDPDTAIVYGTDLDGAVEHSMDKIQRILDRTGCKDFQLHFTAGRESFRYTRVDKEYKANRLVDSQGAKTRGPYGLYQLKQEFCRKFPLKTKLWVECEADDAVWILGDRYPEKYIVCAVDKDVLGATKAKAFNYFEMRSYIHPKSNKRIEAIDMKFVQAEEPEIFWYKQCLTGDAGDGIIGIKGIGPAKAKKILYGCKTNAEMWVNIVEAYEKAGRDMLDALLNMRMVRLDQYDVENNVLTLWDPRTLTEEISDED